MSNDMLVDIDNLDMLTIREVAYILCINSSTVRRWSNKGLLRTYRIGSRGDRRFKREDVTNLLRTLNIKQLGTRSIEVRV